MTKIINAIIVDDEERSIIILKTLIERHCPNINIKETACSVKSAVNKIDELSPDLVFLDIELQDGSGFDILNMVKNKNFETIFITAHNEYAIKAFEFSAIHYLLKPISPSNLYEAVKRFEYKKSQISLEDKIKILSESLKEKQKKIILPSSNGLIIIELDNIVRCESSNNYTTFFLIGDSRIVVSKSINNYEKMLSDLYFVRVHNRHLINLKYVAKYVKGRGGYVLLLDKSHVDVSEGKKKNFLSKLNDFARH